MKVFEQAIKITKNEDKSYNISMSLSDAVVVTKTVGLNDLQRLYFEMGTILKEEV